MLASEMHRPGSLVARSPRQTGRGAVWTLASIEALRRPPGAAELRSGEAAMFEDSTFESMGTIRTRSRGWMLATLALNGSILLALILIPLIYPQALPRITSII